MNQNVVDIKYDIKGKECEFIDRLARLDVNLDRSTPEVDFDSDIFDELFVKMGDNLNSLYLKNKYLYYFAEGAIGYLEALYSMREYIEKQTKYEINNVYSLIKEYIIKHGLNKNINFISLGCGNGTKDLEIFKESKKKKEEVFLKKYVPIDISPYLLQLAIQRFYKESPSTQVTAINSDFLIFDEALIKSIPNDENTRIFTLLGSTLGNYKEKELLGRISSIMQPNDLLVIGVELFQDKEDLKKQFVKYSSTGNYLFLMQPFKLIPKYRGYLDYPNKYFKMDDGNFLHRPEICEVKDALSLTPTLVIPGRGPIYMAWTTKYNYLGLKNDFFRKDNLADIFLELCEIEATKLELNYGVYLLKRNQFDIDILKQNLLTNLNSKKNSLIAKNEKNKLEKIVDLVTACTINSSILSCYELFQKYRTINDKVEDGILKIFEV